MEYFNNLNKRIASYFKILAPDYPEWINEYINTKELLKQQYISVTCGTIYSDLYDNNFFYSSLDHSIAVALIIWNFTHDKKQTLSGLFHDIATPVFKHCIDFLNGDYMNQESTEDLTTYIIENSEEIMSLLKRDNIKLEEVNDYHLYPIADNDTPNLSADRLEYSLSNALFEYNLLSEDEVRYIYNDIYVGKDENGIDELAFNTKKYARTFVKVTSELSVIYRYDKTRYSMQLLADIIKGLNEDGVISKTQLYELKESEVIDIIKNSKYKDIFNNWANAKEIKTSKVEPKDVYYVNHGAKIRYIIPLVKGDRIDKICKLADGYIKKNMSYDMDKYVYLDNIKF